MVLSQNTHIVEKDINGQYHFNGNFKNADLDIAMHSLEDSEYGNLIKIEGKLIHELFENVFNHKLFTGRSGTFFGYEGLGSIYWHMVSKLLLAVQESAINAFNANEEPQIIKKLY